METSLLCEILGLGRPREDNQYPTPELTSTNSGIHDCVFVAIDFEGIENNQLRPESQFGIYVLDTRDIKRAISSTDTNYDMISTSNLILGAKEYCINADAKVIFGESKVIVNDEILEEFGQSIRRQDTIGDQPLRDGVLVGQNISVELRALEALGLDFEDEPQVIATLDTEKIARALQYTILQPERYLKPSRFGLLEPTLWRQRCYFHFASSVYASCRLPADTPRG